MQAPELLWIHEGSNPPLWISCSYYLSAFSFVMVSGLFMGGRDDTDTSLWMNTPLTCPLCSLTSVNHCPLHKEISLIASERCTNIQVKRERDLEDSLVLCPFNRIIVLSLSLWLVGSTTIVY